MCYERFLFLKSGAKQKAQKREEVKPEIARARPDVQPIRGAAERETTRRKEVERQFEDIV
jgi:hypothetical protein